MPDPKQLPYILKLLDDKSPLVQEAVAKGLASYGPSLEEELAKLSEPPDENQKGAIRTLLKAYNKIILKRVWPDWLDLEDSKEKLEEGFALLAEFQNGLAYPIKLKPLLDRLAGEYDSTHARRDVYQLADFLFKDKGFEGAKFDYNNPNNSNLVYVIEKRQGIPISLVGVYILVGHRLGLKIEGCNLPGHFLARTYLGDKIFLVDCFNGGEFIDENILLDEKTLIDMNLQPSKAIQDTIRTEAATEVIIARVLRNLIDAYQRIDDQEKISLMIDLLRDLERRQGRRTGEPLGDLSP